MPQRRRHETVAPARLVMAFPRPEFGPVAHELFEIGVVAVHAVLVVAHAAETVVPERLNLARQFLRAAAVRSEL